MFVWCQIYKKSRKIKPKIFWQLKPRRNKLKLKKGKRIRKVARAGMVSVPRCTVSVSRRLPNVTRPFADAKTAKT